MKCESTYVVFGPWTGKYLDIRILMLLWSNILSFWIFIRISSAAIIHGCLWCDYVQKRVLKDMVSHEKGVEKKFIHVRFNVCGSPLEFPGWFLLLFSAPICTYIHICFINMKVTLTEWNRDFSDYWACEGETSGNSSYSQRDCNSIWSGEDVWGAEDISVQEMQAHVIVVSTSYSIYIYLL